jgi:hypothetical protein
MSRNCQPLSSLLLVACLGGWLCDGRAVVLARISNRLRTPGTVAERGVRVEGHEGPRDVLIARRPTPRS